MVKNYAEIVDFSIIARLQEKDRLAVAEIVAAFFRRDYKIMAQVHIRAGYIAKKTNVYQSLQAKLCNDAKCC